MGHALHEASVESAKPDEERETAFRGRNLPFMVKRLSKRLKDLHPPHEAALITRAVTMAVDAGLPLGAEVVAALKQVATDLQDGSSPEMAQMSSDDLAKCLAGDMPVPQDAPVVQVIAAQIEQVLGKPAEFVASPGTYDQKHIDRIGKLKNCIAYGPGILELAHKPDEYIGVDDMIDSAQVMARGLVDILTKGSP